MDSRSEGSKIKKQESKIQGVTLVELLTVVAVLGVIMIVMAPHLRGTRQAWEVLGDRHPEVLQNGRIGLDKIVRDLRQARSISDAGSDYIEFTDNDGADRRFQLNGGYLEHGLVGALDTLAGPVTSLSFTCYEGDGVTVTTTPEDIRSVLVQMTTSDSEGKVSDITLSSRVFIRRDVSDIMAINEIMYYPTGNPERAWEWVEIYNYTSADVDVAGWKLSDDVQTDDILGDNIHGTGSTVIPAGGYAVITAQDTQVYDPGSPYLVDPNAIKLQVSDNKLGNGLHNNGDIVTILNGSDEVVDSVSYDYSWGGDGNGRSLERIDAQGDPNDPGNWEEGPLYGTPGSQN